MKYLNGVYYVEVKDYGYKIHPNENIILRKRDPPTSLKTHCQVQNNTHIRRNQKLIKNDNDELVSKNCLKIKNKQQLSNSPSCQRNNWLDFDKGYYCKKCEYIINKKTSDR